MALTPEDLQRIATRTLAHYDRSAQEFWEGTRDHDVSQNVQAFLRQIDTPPPFELLDLGCGPGRDLITFKALGHHASGLEGSPQLAAMARAHSGCEVVEQSFLALDLPKQYFDGVFGNAVLFHVPRQELPRVLRELHQTLSRAACSSARTRAVMVTRVGAVSAMAAFTIGRVGAVRWWLRGSPSWTTTTDRPQYRLSSRLGSPASGESPETERIEREKGARNRRRLPTRRFRDAWGAP